MTKPLVSFMIGGAMKCGTSALSTYLVSHPSITLPKVKEAHVFDDPDFDATCSTADINARFQPLYPLGGHPRLFGDNTPISMFHPLFIDRIACYNPAMRWIVLLRDPVERAISHHHMQQVRKIEPLGLFGAIYNESARMRAGAGSLAHGVPLRRWSYIARSEYVRQLDDLHVRFPREQILILRSRDLATRTEETVARAIEFLGLQVHPHPPYPPVFEGGYTPPGPLHPGRLLLRWKLRGEKALLRQRYGIDLDAD